jgi:hypothetical protein
MHVELTFLELTLLDRFLVKASGAQAKVPQKGASTIGMAMFNHAIRTLMEKTEVTLEIQRNRYGQCRVVDIGEYARSTRIGSESDMPGTEARETDWRITALDVSEYEIVVLKWVLLTQPLIEQMATGTRGHRLLLKLRGYLPDAQSPEQSAS